MVDSTEKKVHLASEYGAPEQTAAQPSLENERIERAPETQSENQSRQTKEAGSTISDMLSFRRKPKQVVIPQVRDEVTVKIEKILEDGVGDAYAKLSPIQKQEFKIKGEEVALAIREMVKTTHFKVKKIFRLILEWLKMLPGVNRFFLEQEAKIKTDKIIALAKEHR